MQKSNVLRVNLPQEWKRTVRFSHTDRLNRATYLLMRLALTGIPWLQRGLTRKFTCGM